MRENGWFFRNPGANAYDISEHVRHSLWFMGYRQAWFDCTKSDSPYAGTMRWREQIFPIEWETGRSLIVRLEREDKEIVRGFSTILGFQPRAQSRDADGRYVVEWRGPAVASSAEARATTGERDMNNLP